MSVPPTITQPTLPPLETLPDDPVTLKAIVLMCYKIIEKQGGKVADLQHQIEQMVRRVYGRSSEKWDPNQLLLDEVLLAALDQAQAQQPKEAIKPSVKIEAHTRKITPHGRTIFPETLQREEVIIPVAEAERRCPLTGQERPLIGYEETRKLEYVPPKLIVKVYKREKLGSAANAEETGVITAPPPEGPVPKGMLDNGLMAYLVVSKFSDHNPLYRVEKAFERQGIALSRRTMGDSLLTAAEPLKRLVERVRLRILANGVVHHDDTPVDLLTEGEASGRNIREARLWVGTVPPRDGPWTHFAFSISREGRNVADYFKDYRGFLMSDDFAGYGRLDDERVKRLACMAHVRRKFFEAKDYCPVESAEMLERIRELYKWEASVDPGQEHDAERLCVRQTEALPVLEKMKLRLDEWRRTALPKSPLGKATYYAWSNWEMLIRYTENPRLPIDNNAAEQMIRPVALGRKNWLFLGSERGGEAAAIYMTLTATCKRAGVNPFEYFRDIFGRIMSHSTHKLDELLPGNWKPLHQ